MDRPEPLEPLPEETPASPLLDSPEPEPQTGQRPRLAVRPPQTRRPGWLSSWKPELLLGLTLLAFLGLAYLQRHPLRLGPDNDERRGMAMPPQARTLATDVAVLLAPERISNRAVGLFDTRDWSAWWLNLVEQETGPSSLLLADSFDPEQLADTRVAVVAASAWGELGSDRRRALQGVLERGGVVLSEGEVFGSLTGPGLIELDRSVSSELTRAQQGWHGEVMNLRGRAPLPGMAPGMVQPWTLLAPGAREYALEPWADRQERAIWQQVVDRATVPRWWYFPDQAAGVVAPTHDEEGFGDRSTWMTDSQAARGIPSTVFAIAGASLTRRGVDRMLASGADVQLHWNRGFFDQRVERPLGWGPFHPLVRELGLVEQRDELARMLPAGRRPTLNRNHGLVWDGQWGRSFRLLASAGVAADSTYGPSGRGRFGYIFGTGLPFRPLDDSGFPLPLHEVPFLWQDDEEYSPARQQEVLQRSQAGDHQLIVPIFHVNTMARVPSRERIEGWLALGEQARGAEHRLMDLGSFLRFWWGRSASPLRSRWEQGSLIIDARPTVEGLSVRLPEQAGGRGRLVELTVDGERRALEGLVRRGDSPLLPLAIGRHELRLEYR